MANRLSAAAACFSLAVVCLTSCGPASAYDPLSGGRRVPKQRGAQLQSKGDFAAALAPSRSVLNLLLPGPQAGGSTLAPTRPTAGGGDFVGAAAEAFAGAPAIESGDNPPSALAAAFGGLGGEDASGVSGADPNAGALATGDVAIAVGGPAAACQEVANAWMSASYWTSQGKSRTPESASGVFIDPTILAAADQTMPFGGAGGWCRPANEPYAGSSPIANGSFWIFALVLAGGAATLLISRGWRLPA